MGVQKEVAIKMRVYNNPCVPHVLCTVAMPFQKNVIEMTVPRWTMKY